jgi:hypothetical protein
MTAVAITIMSTTMSAACLSSVVIFAPRWSGL